MSDLVLNWTTDDLINVGIGFGFLLGFVTCILVVLADEATEYFKNKKKDKK